MNEELLVWLVPIRLFAVIVYCLAYVISGRGGPKWIRRWLGPALFALLCWIVAMFLKASLIGLTPLLAIPVVLSFGYSNNDGKGWIRRLIYGLSFGVIGLVMSFIYWCWPLGMIHMIICVMASMVLGLLNPIEAVNEEAMISSLSVICIPFIIG